MRAAMHPMTIDQFEELIHNGADIHSVDYAGNTILSVAIIELQPKKIKSLLKRGIDVERESGPERNRMIHDVLHKMFSTPKQKDIEVEWVRKEVLKMFKLAIKWNASMEEANKAGETGLSLLEKLETLVEGKEKEEGKEVRQLRRYYMKKRFPCLPRKSKKRVHVEEDPIQEEVHEHVEEITDDEELQIIENEPEVVEPVVKRHRELHIENNVQYEVTENIEETEEQMSTNNDPDVAEKVQEATLEGDPEVKRQTELQMNNDVHQETTETIEETQEQIGTNIEQQAAAEVHTAIECTFNLETFENVKSVHNIGEVIAETIERKPMEEERFNHEKNDARYSISESTEEITMEDDSGIELSLYHDLDNQKHGIVEKTQETTMEERDSGMELALNYEEPLYENPLTDCSPITLELRQSEIIGRNVFEPEAMKPAADAFRNVETVDAARHNEDAPKEPHVEFELYTSPIRPQLIPPKNTRWYKEWKESHQCTVQFYESHDDPRVQAELFEVIIHMAQSQLSPLFALQPFH